MTRVVIYAVGSRGDVEPCLALGIGMRAAGYAVRIAALDDARASTTARGLEFASLGALPARFASPGRAPSFQGLVGRALFWAVYQRILASTLPAFVDAGDGADLIVYTGLGFPGYHLAEARGLPCASLAFVPGAATGAFVNPLFARRGMSQGACFNRASFRVEHELMLQSTAHHLAGFRRALGLGPLPRRQLLAHRWSRTDAVLLAVSPSLVPRPVDWGPRVHLTGSLRLPAAREVEVAPTLQAFLERGAAPVYVGFGSMTRGAAARRSAAVVSALGQLGLRGVLARGWGGMSLEACDLPAHVCVVDEVAHDWLFRRVQAVVHHGGAGTTAAALRAGQPAVIAPFAYDQWFWGRLLAARELGPAPIAATRLDARRLAAALDRLQRTPRYRANIAPIAAALQAEDGVAAAVAILRRLCPL
ncbi:MAG: glycosyltransferase family 1 protein [Myxococcales bacterium]|nr:glycosyltransferase family 1 protein [Myxococcales bacterium]